MPTVRSDEPAYTGAWLASRLGIEPRKLDLRRRSGELLAVPADADGTDWVYPAWQFDRNGRPIPAVERVMAAGREAGLDAQALDAVLQRRDGLTGTHRIVDSLLEGNEEHVLETIRAAGR
jgi:hypothetical protein